MIRLRYRFWSWVDNYPANTDNVIRPLLRPQSGPSPKRKSRCWTPVKVPLLGKAQSEGGWGLGLIILLLIIWLLLFNGGAHVGLGH